jgi:hypothetical protein
MRRYIYYVPLWRRVVRRTAPFAAIAALLVPFLWPSAFAKVAGPFRPSAAVSSVMAPAVYYRTCNQARIAGAAPIDRGQPGYREDLDADADGVACEPWRGS